MSGFKRLCFSFSVSIFLIYFILILSLLYFFDAQMFMETVFSKRTLYSIQLSVLSACVSSFVALIFAVPAAYALSRYEFFGKDIIDTILELPMVVSPAALGAMLLIFFNNPIGEWIQENTIRFVFSISGVILAQFITVLGVATRLVKSALDEISPRYEIVAQTLGATPWQAFKTVTLPLLRNGLISATILTWAKALGEFGASITLAGSMAMKTETIPVAIYMRLASAQIEQSVVVILLLISLGLGLLYLSRVFLKRRSLC
ncbi:MAG: ABC transporter permease [Candidatus Cloacimonetes bacterium]|nr:ABC transporter permease [Candidatus Cloacimonadota bacterium]